MDVLLLGGTAWLGREIGRVAVDRGHRVTALARGESGGVPEGVVLARGDRDAPGAYDVVGEHEWDAVIDLTRQPGQARSAAAALAPVARRVVFVSTVSVYARNDEPGADETAETLPALADDRAEPEQYGEGKVACERAWADAVDGRLAVVRPGLIAGPGDPSDRAGYWVARAARDDEPMLVPDAPDAAVQTIDVRDLAEFVVDLAERPASGAEPEVLNAVGDEITLGVWLDVARRVAGFGGEVVAAPPAWLLEHGVAQWSGPESLPLWVDEPSMAAFQRRSNTAARAAGLRLRPLEETLADTLVSERERGLGRERRAGLSAARERELVAALRADRSR